MSEFKKSIRDYKTSCARNRKRKKRNNIGVLTHFLILCAIVSASLLLFFYVKPENNINSSTEQSTTNPSGPTINIVEHRPTIDIQMYINKLRDIIVFMDFKLHISKKSSLNEQLTEQIWESIPQTQSYIKETKYYQSKIDTILREVRENKSHIDKTYLYYKAIIYYLQLFLFEHHSFYSGRITSIIEALLVKSYTTFDIKFVYQQCHIMDILYLLVRILDTFNYIILDEVKERINNKIFIQFCDHIFSYLNKLHNTMFTVFIGEVSFNLDNIPIKLENLLHSFDQYKHYVIINIYIVYVHLFDVDNNKQVTNLNKKFVDKLGLNIGNKEEMKELIFTCKKLFIENTENGTIFDAEFMKEYEESYKKCNEVLINIFSEDFT